VESGCLAGGFVLAAGSSGAWGALGVWLRGWRVAWWRGTGRPGRKEDVDLAVIESHI